MAEKIVSVIIPCYNVEKYIDRCFEGLVSQTIGMDSMEIIIVDDASTDETVQKLKYYEQQYPESVMLIMLEKNGGQGAARNIAIQYATAPYIGFVDSDDCIDPSLFKTMTDIIEDRGCDFVECDWDFFSETGKGYTSSSFELGTPGYYDFSIRSVKDDYISKQLFFTSVWNKIFKRSFLDENGIFFPEGVKYEDMFFCYLAILYSKSYCYIDKYLYHYYLNPNGTIQRRKESYQFDMMDVAYLFLNTTKEKGLYEQFKNEIDWMFMEKYYVYMIWDIWELFPEEAYTCYLNMKEDVKKIVPDYGQNPFRSLPENKMDDVILRLIDMPLSREQFEGIMEKLWKQQKR